MITLCIPYYESPKMLAKQVEYWNYYEDSVAERFEIVVVDDGSPRNPAEDVLRGVSCKIAMRLYRIQQNIPWNVEGALNLAIHNARTEWIYSLAVDHVLPGTSAAILLNKELCPKLYYRALRHDVNERGIPVHEPRKGLGNLFLMTKELFDRAGGYNEYFAGYYGGAGNAFKRHLNSVAKEGTLNDVWLLHFGDGACVADASVQDWGRQGSKYQVTPRMLANGKKRPVNPLRFDWEEIKIHSYDTV